MDSALSFRRALPVDAADITKLVNIAYRGDVSRQGWTTEADLLDGLRTSHEEVMRLISMPDSMLWLCFRSSELVGSVHIEKFGDDAHFGMFVIRPDLQGQGIGKQLMQVVELQAQLQWQVKKLVMHVISLRHELLQFYERRGYRRTGLLETFPVNPEMWRPKVESLQLELLEKVIA